MLSQNDLILDDKLVKGQFGLLTIVYYIWELSNEVQHDLVSNNTKDCKRLLQCLIILHPNSEKERHKDTVQFKDLKSEKILGEYKRCDVYHKNWSFRKVLIFYSMHFRQCSVQFIEFLRYLSADLDFISIDWSSYNSRVFFSK